jgi:hypothetical protein
VGRAARGTCIAPRHARRAVERGLAGDHSVLVNLFTDAEYHFMESSPHIWLLWALEALAWSPEYLGPAALLLAKLARLDPGGTLNNRPIRSLEGIFLCWHPGTAAPLAQRLRGLDTIRKRESHVAWPLLVSLLPKHTATAFNTAEPRWRAWMPEERPAVTYGELFKAAKEVIRRLLADVGTDGGRWHDLIECLAGIPGDEFQAIVGHLLTLGLQAFSPADRLQVWDSLRGVISRHLEFPDAEWALPRAQVEQLQQIYTRLEPADPVAQRSWLFAHTPVFPHAGYTE